MVIDSDEEKHDDVDGERQTEEDVADSISAVMDTDEGVSIVAVRPRRVGPLRPGKPVTLMYAHGWRSGKPYLFRPGDAGFEWVHARSLLPLGDRISGDRRGCEARGIVWSAVVATDEPSAIARQCRAVVSSQSSFGHLDFRWYCGITANPVRRWVGFLDHANVWQHGHSRRPGGPWVMHIVGVSSTTGVAGTAENVILKEANDGRPLGRRGWAKNTTGKDGNVNVLFGGEGDGFGVGPWYVYVLVSSAE